MKILVQIARVLIGITFIYSGYVKLVDPIGSAIKLTEYFSEDVLNIPFLEPYVLPLSILLIVSELLLGVMILIGYKPKWSVYAISLLMLVFLFLTWYSAYFDKVNDCGCFGDAIKISPWATFYKNVFFSALILILIFGLKHLKPWFGRTITNSIPIFVLFGSLYLSYYVLHHLPIHDFRPFAIGKSIPDGMQDVDGEDFPPIHDFILETPDGDDLTDTVLDTEKVLLIISYNLTYSDEASYLKIKDLTDKALEQGYTIYALTASFVDEFENIKEVYELSFDMLYCDETTLKTMIRSNPGVMTLNKGTVTGKWNWRAIDTIKLK
jgi:uncharacterized membrane protein YphA (DoxX/SURF4 family)